MSSIPLKHLSDSAVLRQAKALAARARESAAVTISYIAEFDARRLYRPDHSTMFGYCVDALHMAEDEAHERIMAARLARRFPVIFEMLADGRLNATTLDMLAPHLTSDNADDLLALASHQNEHDLHVMLTERQTEARDAAS